MNLKRDKSANLTGDTMCALEWHKSNCVKEYEKNPSWLKSRGILVCAERFGFYDNSGDAGEKITRLRKTMGGLSARTPRLSVPNDLDFLKTPGSEAEKYPASGKPETGFAAGRSPLELIVGIEPTTSSLPRMCSAD